MRSSSVTTGTKVSPRHERDDVCVTLPSWRRKSRRSMKRPQNLVYGLDDKPPAVIVALNGLQHCAVVSINLVIVVFVARAAGGSVQVVADVLAVAMLVLSIGTMLQTARVGPVGSGFMCPATFSA